MRPLKGKSSSGVEEQGQSVAILQRGRNVPGYFPAAFQKRKKRRESRFRPRCRNGQPCKRRSRVALVLWGWAPVRSCPVLSRPVPQCKWRAGAFRAVRGASAHPKFQEEEVQRSCASCPLKGDFKQLWVCVWPTDLGFVMRLVKF